MRTICAPVPPVCSRGVRKRGAWPRPCPLHAEHCGGQARPRPAPRQAGVWAPASPEPGWAAGPAPKHLLERALREHPPALRRCCQGPDVAAPARTLKWIPQCNGLWGRMGTESGHVGGGFVGGSAPPGKRLGGKLAPGSAARLVGTQLAQTSAIGRGPHPTPTGQRPALGPPAARLRDSMCVAEAQVCGLGYGSPWGPRRWPRSCREEHAGFRIGRIPEAEMR